MTESPQGKTPLPNTCASILLAAGSSSRLGKPKQLLHVDGDSLLRRTVRIAIDSGCSPNLVVLGACAEILRPELQGLDTQVLLNEDWRQGMGGSLALAVSRLLEQTVRPTAVLVLVCDQPGLSAPLLRTLIERQATGGLVAVASRYSGRLGVPAVFSPALYPQLAALKGDQGARAILSQCGDQVAGVEFPAGGFDIDTPADEMLLHRPER